MLTLSPVLTAAGDMSKVLTSKVAEAVGAITVKTVKWLTGAVIVLLSGSTVLPSSSTHFPSAHVAMTRFSSATPAGI